MLSYSPHRERFASELKRMAQALNQGRTLYWKKADSRSLLLTDFSTLHCLNASQDNEPINVYGVVMIDDPRLFTFRGDLKDIGATKGVNMLRWYLDTLYAYYLFHWSDIVAISVLILTYLVHQSSPNIAYLVAFLSAMVYAFVSVVGAIERLRTIFKCSRLIQRIQSELIDYHQGIAGIVVTDSFRHYSLVGNSN